MISRVFGYDDLGQFGLQWLKSNFLGDILQNRYINISMDRKSLKNDFKRSYIDEKELEKYRYIHPYMYQRKLTDKIIEIFDVRI